MEGKLQTHLELFKSILNQFPDAFFLRDLQGIYLLVNPTYAALREHSVFDYPGHSVQELVPPDTAKKILSRDREVLRRGRTLVFEDVIPLKGTAKTYQVTSGLCRDEQGRPLAIFGVLHEITLEKQARATLVQSEARLRSIWEMAADAMILTDGEGTILAANPAYLQLCGYTADELLGESFSKLSPEKEHTRLLEQYRLCFTYPSDTVVYESTLWKKNGLVITCETRVGFIKQNGVRIAMISSLRDITRRKQIEEKLRQSEALLAEAQQMAHLGSFQVDLQKNQLELSQEAYQIIDLPAGSGENTLESSLALIHPDDLERVWHAIETTVIEIERAEVEFRLCPPNRKVRQVQSVLSPVVDNTGTVVRILGTMLDITHRKGEEARLQAEARRSAVLASLSQTFAEAGLDIPSLTRIVAEQAAGLFEAICVFGLCSEDGEWFDITAYQSPDTAEPVKTPTVLQSFRIKVNQWKLNSLDDGGLPFFRPCLTPEEALGFLPQDLWPLIREHASISLMAVPLRPQARSVGALLVARLDHTTAFTLEDTTFLKDLASRAGFAIENARLYAAEARRASELNALYTATTALLGTLDLDALLGRILDAALQAIPAADKGQLNLTASQTGPLEVRAGVGWNDPRIQTFSLQRLNGYLARAVHERRPFLIADFTENDQDTRTSSAIVAPLLLAEKNLGVIVLTAKYRAAFSEADLQLLVNFAATTSAALQNAMLHAEVQRLAVTDALTTLYNRRGFFELAHKEIERARRFDYPISALMLDIDRFKEINDTRGHAAGDEAIRSIASCLASGLREFDLIGRLGGDEFTILLPQTDLAMALIVGDRLRKRISGLQIYTETGAFSATISLGAAQAADGKELNLDTLLRKADQALYQAKMAGRDRVEGSQGLLSHPVS